MAFQTSLGIDITQDQVALVYLKKSLRGTKLGAQGVFPLAPAEPGADRWAAVEACVADFIADHRIAPEGVFIGLAPDRVISRRLEFPLAVKENLRETLRYEMEKYIPVPVEEVCYDYQVLSEDKASGQLSLMLVMAKRSDVLDCCQLADRLKIGLFGIEPRAGALVNFLAGTGGLQGNGVAALAFVEERQITVGLVSDQRLLYSGSRAIGDSAEDLAGEATESVRRLKRLLPGADGPLPLLLFGDRVDAEVTAGLEGSDEFALHWVQPEASAPESWAAAPAYGLALKGLRQVPVQIDLVPEGMRRKPSRIGYYMMVVLAVLMVLAGLAWAGSNMLYQRRVLERLDAEIETLETDIQTVDHLQAEAKRTEEWIAYLNAMRRGGVAALDILADVTERTPETAWVRDLTLNESDLRLDGYADSASELLPLLEDSPYFREVVFLSTITKGKDGKERFRIGGKIDRPGSEGEAAQ